MAKKFTLDKVLFQSFEDGRDFIIAKYAYEVLVNEITEDQLVYYI